MRSWTSRRVLAALVVLGTVLAACSGAGGTPRAATPPSSPPPEAIFPVATPHAAGGPARYDNVQIRRYGNPAASRVLVLVPGTFGGAADFDVAGPYLAEHVPNLQVWAEMRREGALEDNSMLLRGLAGTATPKQVLDYYIGWVSDPKISPHYQPLSNQRHRLRAAVGPGDGDE